MTFSSLFLLLHRYCSEATLLPSHISTKCIFHQFSDVKEQMRRASVLQLCTVSWPRGGPRVREDTVIDHQHLFFLLCFFLLPRLECICEVWESNFYPAPQAGLQLPPGPVHFLQLCRYCPCFILSCLFTLQKTTLHYVQFDLENVGPSCKMRLPSCNKVIMRKAWFVQWRHVQFTLQECDNRWMPFQDEKCEW